jgi:hypothetical protein
MVVHHLYIMGVAIHPAKHDSPLIIHPYAVKPSEITAKGFKSIAGRRPKIHEILDSV